MTRKKVIEGNDYDHIVKNISNILMSCVFCVCGVAHKINLDIVSYTHRHQTMKLVFFLSITTTSVLAFTPQSHRVSNVMNMVGSTMQAPDEGGPTMDHPFFKISSIPTTEIEEAEAEILGAVSAQEPHEARKMSLGARSTVNGDLVLDPSFRLAKDLSVVGSALILLFPTLAGLSAGALSMVTAAYIWRQTDRVRLVFGEDSFEFFNLSNDKKTLVEKPSNFALDIVNRWTYDSIVDYGFFPSQEYPLIVYFKETATPKEQWGRNEQWDGLRKLFDINKMVSQEGQAHFFPGLVDVNEFVKQMEARGIKRSDSIIGGKVADTPPGPDRGVLGNFKKMIHDWTAE